MSSVNFSITFLGTSAASISPGSSTSSYLVEVNQTRILVDAGIGTLRQLRKAEYSPEDIDMILVTHWHLDHFAGLPAVLKARRKSNPLSLLSPAVPLSARIFMASTLCPPGIYFESVKGYFSRNYEGFRLQAIPNSHAIDSCGWVISEEAENSLKQRKIVLSGDTRPVETILNASCEADLLVHEATYLSRDSAKAVLHQHSTAAEAAGLALKAGVKALALTHIPGRYTREEVLTEAQKIFPRVYVPSHGDKIRLGSGK